MQTRSDRAPRSPHGLSRRDIITDLPDLSANLPDFISDLPDFSAEGR